MAQLTFQYIYKVSGSGAAWTVGTPDTGTTFIEDGSSLPLDGTIIDTDGSTVLDATADAGFSATNSGSLDFSGAKIEAFDSVTGGDVVITTTSGSYLLTNNENYAVSNAPALDTDSGNYTAYCFLTGTRISTPNGSIAVEALKVGDEVLTVDGNITKVRFNFSQVKTSNIFVGKKHFPILISAGALAENVPSADLYVTPDHAMYLPELNIFAEASTLINGVSIYQMTEMPETFTYYHILCDNQEIVLANNAPAETFIDNATMQEFDNYADYAAMYPDSHEMIELDIPRAKAARQLPRALKQQLADRAFVLFPTSINHAA